MPSWRNRTPGFDGPPWQRLVFALMPKPKQSLIEPTTVAAYVEAITRALQARGADPDEVLREIDVLRIHGNDPLVRITDSTVNAIYARAVALTGDEYFGLRVAEHIVPGTLHALGYALLASETLEDFCHRFVRYYGLVSQSADLRILVEGDTFRLEADPRSPDICVETQDVWAALVLRLMRMAYRADFCSRALDLRRPVPAGGEEPFRAFFGCPVRFGQPHLCFHFELAAMREPLLGANRELAQHNDQIAMTYLEKLDRDDIANRVRTQLVNGLNAGIFSRAEIATRMHMSPSTLQAKLARQGVSFLQVLDDTRQQLALGYVQQKRLSITEIAFMLGFSDVSNFNRAFRRWTGKAPSEFRVGAI